jgi:MFS transporter, PPP family, 3-phenylpropionic acid transporter
MRRTWPFTFYFLYFAALAAFSPFVVLYWQSIGLTGAQIGALSFITPVVVLLSSPLWTGWADGWRIHRLLMALAIAGAAAAAAAVPLVATFPLALVIAPLFAFFSAPVIPMADGATISSLAAEGVPQMYGRVRLGGTFGWALAAPLVGALVAARGLPVAFWTYAVLMLLAMVIGLRFRFPAQALRVRVWQGMGRLVRQRAWLFFLLLGLVSGMGFAAVNNYLFAYLKELGINTTISGLALTVSTISEIPILFFANRILNRLGARGMLTLSVLLTGVRLVLYAVFTSPAGILFFQLLNGFTFPAFWVAAVAYANENAPSGMEASAQGLFGAAVMGVGAALGGLLGGLLLDAIGGRGMYLVFGGVVLGGMLVLNVVERATGAPKTRTDAMQ